MWFQALAKMAPSPILPASRSRALPGAGLDTYLLPSTSVNFSGATPDIGVLRWKLRARAQVMRKKVRGMFLF